MDWKEPTLCLAFVNFDEVDSEARQVSSIDRYSALGTFFSYISLSAKKKASTYYSIETVQSIPRL
jgi:hypothetical protein